MKIDPDRPPDDRPCWEVCVTYWDADPCAEPQTTTVGYYDSYRSALSAKAAALRGKRAVFSAEHQQHSVWQGDVTEGRFVENAPYDLFFEPGA